MGVSTRHCTSIYIIQFVWIFLLISQESNLVKCDVLDDDSLQSALEAVERRQRNLQLQENEFYGQPENIGYGFQKNFGFFQEGPAQHVGAQDSDSDSDNELQNMLLGYLKSPGEEDYASGLSKRKSSFRERGLNDYLVGEKQGEEDYETSGIEYLKMLKKLWSKYRQSHPEDLEELTDDQVEDLLRSLSDNGNDDGFVPDEVDPRVPDRYSLHIPLRARRNYRVFDHLGDRSKRYPAFGQGLYGKRIAHAQHSGYEASPESDVLYPLTFPSPDVNREAVEMLRDKDKDILRMLNGWQGPGGLYQREQEGSWLQDPVYYPEEAEPQHIFKQHNGLHLNTKRFPVKRSADRVQNPATDEKVAKEIKGIFGPPEGTTVPPKKVTTKKPTEVAKKVNVTKPEVTKHREVKKVVRRAEPLSKEVYPAAGNVEISHLFQVHKKGIDWSKHFGLNFNSKRSPTWLRQDALNRAESHLLLPKTKRFSHAGNVNFFDPAQYQTPFDTRVFKTQKRFSHDLAGYIDKMESRIGNMEEKMIDDAVKYTGAHTGGAGEQAGQVKHHVIQNLEAAYSLEKMKSALEDFKNSMKTDEHFGAVESSTTKMTESSVKTERPETSSQPAGEPQEKKRLAEQKDVVMDGDTLAFLPGQEVESDDGDCPVLEQVLHNCLRVEELSGPYAELLLPICTLQQVCYLCGNELGLSRRSNCDLMYLSEAQNLCQSDSECLESARNSMLALRDINEQEMLKSNGEQLSGSCSDNPCIQRYFMSSPGAVVPLEFQSNN